MDLALTFHIGLCLRILEWEPPPPTSPLGRSWPAGEPLDEANEALRHADRGRRFQRWACVAVKRS